MNLIKKITTLFSPGHAQQEYRDRVAMLYKGRKGPVQVQNRTALPDDDMYRYIGKLTNDTWAAKLVSERKEEWFTIFYFGEVVSDTIMMSEETVASKVKVTTRLKEAIELYDMAYDGYDAVFVDVYEEDKMEERTAATKYVTENGDDEFRLLIVVQYHAETDKEINEQLTQEGKITDDYETVIDENLAINNCFSSIHIYAFGKSGNVYPIIDEETA